MNVERRGLSLRVLPVVLLAAAASLVVSVAAVRDIPSAADFLAALTEAGAPRERLLFTLAQAAGATALGVAVGLVASWFLARAGMPLAPVFRVAMLVPVAVPGVAFALGLRELAAGDLAPAALVVWGHAAFAAGVTAWVVTPAWGSSEPRLVDQAVLLGSTRWRALLAGARRSVGSSLVLACALGFANAAAAVGSVLLLGDEATWTVEALLLREAQSGDTGVTASLAGIQLLLGLVAYLGARRWTAGAGGPLRASAGVRAAGVVVLLVLVAPLLAPVVALVAGAVRVEAGASSAFAGLLDAELAGAGVGRSLAWSATYALTAGVVATALAWLVAPYVASLRRPRFRGLPVALLALVLLVSPVVSALGAREAAQALEVDLQRTWAVMAGVHALVVFPVALRVLTSVAHVDGHRLAEAAVLLGQGPRSARWRWRRRYVLRGVLSSVLIALALLIGEVGAAALLAPASAVPATVSVLEASPPGRDAPSLALAVATVLSGAAVVAFTLGEWLRRSAGSAGTGAGGASVEGR
ncbi:MAG: hypothetical protein M0R73_06535 [Dehalococcoidia bacterium]|nr:hypothetical protein [Dehalococcoidia bacterium]